MLGFKTDGTGRREVEANILRDSQDEWREHRDRVHTYLEYENEIKALDDNKKRLEELKIIYKNQKAQADKEEAESKKISDAQKAIKKKKAGEALKKHREEWLEKIEELSKKNNF